MNTSPKVNIRRRSPAVRPVFTWLDLFTVHLQGQRMTSDLMQVASMGPVALIERVGGVRAAARVCGVSPSFLTDVRKGNKRLPDKHRAKLIEAPEAPRKGATPAPNLRWTAPPAKTRSLPLKKRVEFLEAEVAELRLLLAGRASAAPRSDGEGFAAALARSPASAESEPTAKEDSTPIAPMASEDNVTPAELHAQAFPARPSASPANARRWLREDKARLLKLAVELKVVPEHSAMSAAGLAAALSRAGHDPVALVDGPQTEDEMPDIPAEDAEPALPPDAFDPIVIAGADLSAPGAAMVLADLKLATVEHLEAETQRELVALPPDASAWWSAVLHVALVKANELEGANAGDASHPAARRKLALSKLHHAYKGANTYNDDCRTAARLKLAPWPHWLPRE